ncbi:phospho-N-acetylmuramoyl-pentapeptide-transferase [uncultured Faecalibaculum sp.]|uniref:phospho-N-acetylmuramoyl-pentapeptide- transferase n=1 Tax=uncultured Faecalibaculum sp. TaxID=1729681 RepID=UPI00262E0066|nr:phospho-N-acetylmuramoyl-pentapeptide-transferase [uncultured Faecalibaculum sp.]
MVYSAWMTAILAGVICLVIMLMIMPGLIRYLHKIKFGQTEREEGLESHKKKNGTPTMGGLAFILVPTIIYIAGSFILPDMRFSQNILIILLAYVGYGLIGFLDDYIIVVKKDNEGLKPGAKFLLQAVLAIIFFMIYRSGSSTEIWIPLADIYIDLGWAYFLLVVLMFTAETNAVNLTDGIDGLCAGLMVIALVPFAVFASVQHQYPVLVLIIMVIASLLGYLRFNLHPAKIFMGDTGSLALGGFIAAVAMVLKQELLLVIIGFVFVAEVLSVIIQVTHFKRTGKRIFRMAPLHHHFEKGGMTETAVVHRFWAAGILLAALGLLLYFL